MCNMSSNSDKPISLFLSVATATETHYIGGTVCVWLCIYSCLQKFEHLWSMDVKIRDQIQG